MFGTAVRSVNINSASYKTDFFKSFFNSFMTEALIIQKPVHWFMEQINVLVSIWYGPPSWKSKTHFRPIFTYISIKSTHFKPLSHLYTPWKRQKIFQYPLFLGSTEKFSDVFRRYRNGTLAWNGLKWTIGWKQVKVYPSQKFSAVARTDIYWITFSEKWIGLERQECILFLDIFV